MTGSPFQKKGFQGFEYVDEGERDAPAILLLHGMLGGTGNWSSCIRYFSNAGFRVLAPSIPMYQLPLKQASISGLLNYVKEFVEAMDLERFSIFGNSIGGHIALMYAHAFPEEVNALVLSGASGIYEIEWGQSVIRRSDREFIREKAGLTFYDPSIVTEDLVDFLIEVGSHRDSVVRLLKIARSSKLEKVDDLLTELQQPTLLIWGQDDIVTPPFVAEIFLDKMPNARLEMFERCGHAPMIECPDRFNERSLPFIESIAVENSMV